MVSRKRLFLEGISRIIVALIIVICTPLYLSIKIYEWLLYYTNAYGAAYITGSCFILLMLLFLTILGLAVEEVK